MRSLKDLKALFGFMTSTRNLVLLPILTMLVVIGLLIIVTHSSAVAPLIYTLF